MKKRSKLAGRGVRIPSPRDEAVRKTERSAVSVVAGWIREITAAKGLPLGHADVDTSGPDGKSPDLVIYERPGGTQVLLLGEFKPPYFEAFDEEALKIPAREKANRRKASYFATSNFRQLVWYSTQRVNEMAPEEQQLVAAPYELSSIESLDLIDEPRVASSIRRALEEFLDDLVAVHYDKRVAPKLPLDAYLIARIHALVNLLARRYQSVVAERAHKERDFDKALATWFRDQMWSYTPGSEADYAKVARQAAYLQVNKILFYHVLQSRRPRDLDPLDIPESVTRGNVLQKQVQAFFSDVIQNIDYETIYSTDFIDDIAFPSDPEAVRLVRVLNELLRRHDVGKLGYDILGPIFERLIPPRERHNLGQYFTNPDVVDLILGFCIRKEDDVTLDPACGAGTFLVRAYQHKRLMNPRTRHTGLLKTLWGVDIAKFPAHLSLINLALQDLASHENYPQILQKDFFDVSSALRGMKAMRFEVKRFSGETASVTFPPSVDAIVGNPPYTRQEEIDLIAKSGGYKRQLVEKALENGGPGSEGISGQAGIHTYFFIHGTKFLRQGGRFGFVVSDTWLDAAFGAGLKRFLLANYRISMVIASRVERWFADADINTCILLLERETDDAKRSSGCVRFVQLKRPLRDLIPTGGGSAERPRFDAIAKLCQFFGSHNARYENDDARIVPVTQSSLAPEEKWGLFLRAPLLLFDILNRNSSRLKSLSSLSDVCFGVKTGADPWFYVKDVSASAPAELRQKAKTHGFRGRLETLALVESGDGTRWLIEKEFLEPVARNPDQYHSVRIERDRVPDLAVVLPAKDRSSLSGRMVLHYIVHGERRTYPMGKGRKLVPAKTESCKARPFWYALPDIQRSCLLWEKAIDVRFRHHLADRPILANQRFYPIVPSREISVSFVAGFLNSAFVTLWLEVQRAALGQGALEATVEEVKNLLVVDPRDVPPKVRNDVERALGAVSGRDIGTVFEEYGGKTAEEVQWESIPPDRRALEDAVLGGVLGLSQDERLDFVRSLVDLTQSRMARAQSLETFGEEERATMKEFAHRIVKGLPLT